MSGGLSRHCLMDQLLSFHIYSLETLICVFDEFTKVLSTSSFHCSFGLFRFVLCLRLRKCHCHKPCAYLPVNGVQYQARCRKALRKIPHGTKNAQPPEEIDVRYTSNKIKEG